jgi:hypothetical protein
MVDGDKKITSSNRGPNNEGQIKDDGLKMKNIIVLCANIGQKYQQFS